MCLCVCVCVCVCVVCKLCSLHCKLLFTLQYQGNTCHEGLSDQARPVVIEGIPSSDSQCLLNDFESQPPSPRIDSYSHPAEPPTSVSVIPIVQCTQVYSPLLFTEGDIDTEEEEDLPHADMGEREMEDLATIEHGQDSLNK